MRRRVIGSDNSSLQTGPYPTQGIPQKRRYKDHSSSEGPETLNPMELIPTLEFLGGASGTLLPFLFGVFLFKLKNRNLGKRVRLLLMSYWGT